MDCPPAPAVIPEGVPKDTPYESRTACEFSVVHPEAPYCLVRSEHVLVVLLHESSTRAKSAAGRQEPPDKKPPKFLGKIMEY